MTTDTTTDTTTTTREAELRGDRRLCGVRIRLADGVRWCVPPRPACGPQAEAICVGLDRLDGELAERASGLQAQAVDLAERAATLDSAVARALAAAGADEEGAAELLEQARTTRTAELEKLTAEGRAMRAEGKQLEREQLAAALDVIRAALTLNYPGFDDDDLARVVSVAHIEPLLRIVRGQIELDDILPDAESPA